MPGDIVFFDHDTAIHERKRRRGIVVATNRDATVLPGLSDAPAHGLFVRFEWSPATAYCGLVRDTHFDLLDSNDVSAADIERVGKLPPEAFRLIAEAFERLGAP